MRKRLKLLTIVLTWFAGRQTVLFRKKKGRAGVAVVEAQGTTVSLNAGWFMLPAHPLPAIILNLSKATHYSQGLKKLWPVCARLGYAGTELL